jgi:hypothetical protein
VLFSSKSFGSLVPVVLRVDAARLEEASLSIMVPPLLVVDLTGVQAGMPYLDVVFPKLPLLVLDLPVHQRRAPQLVQGPVRLLTVFPAVIDLLAGALHLATRRLASCAAVGIREELRHP